MDTPNLDLVVSVQHTMTVLRTFIRWLNKTYNVELDEEALVYSYFGIDSDALEQELKSIYQQHKDNSDEQEQPAGP